MLAKVKHFVIRLVQEECRKISELLMNCLDAYNSIV